MKNPHVVVVGAGVFGAWTAHHLVRAGARVTLVDAYGPANPRSSSSDHSRILRCGYGADEIYSRFARRSLELWRELDARIGGDRPIWHRCGVLWLASADDGYTAATQQTLSRGGYEYSVLDRRELQARYPQLTADDISLALLEPECGVLMARRAVQSLAIHLARDGVRIVHGRVQPSQVTGPLRAVALTDGTEIRGDMFVFACGAWLPAIFPRLLGGRIRPTRQVVVYLGAPGGDDRFGPARLPAWVDFPGGVYGVPDLEHRGVKVGIDEHGPPIDPDSDDRIADDDRIAKARAWVARRLPALANAPVVEARVCQYENTATGDFLIDRHPEHENAWIVGGGSGHGFKHGPAVGEYAANMLLQQGTPESRFELREPAADVRRSVY